MCETLPGQFADVHSTAASFLCRHGTKVCLLQKGNLHDYGIAGTRSEKMDVSADRNWALSVFRS